MSGGRSGVVANVCSRSTLSSRSLPCSLSNSSEARWLEMPRPANSLKAGVGGISASQSPYVTPVIWFTELEMELDLVDGARLFVEVTSGEIGLESFLPRHLRVKVGKRVLKRSAMPANGESECARLRPVMVVLGCGCGVAWSEVMKPSERS